jgi:hypothetical protein
MRLDCAIFVASCDKYSDLWPGFFYCLRKHWGQSDLSVYLGSGTKICQEAGVVTIQTEPKLDWSSAVLKQLNTLEHNYIIFMLDDFFLRRNVDGTWIDAILEYAQNVDAAMIRLLPRPPPCGRSHKYPFISTCSLEREYSICTQASLWNRLELIRVLQRGESIWEFEERARFRAGELTGRIYCCEREALPYRGRIFHHVVEKGKWLPTAYLWCWLNGVPISRKQRDVMGIGSFLPLLAAEAFNRVLVLTFGASAPNVRSRIKKALPSSLNKLYARMRGYK